MRERANNFSGVVIRRVALPMVLLLLQHLTLRADNFDIRAASEFQKIVPANAELKKLAGGMHFVEGPAWFERDGGYLMFSDIPAEELKKWSAREGLTAYRTNTHGANGNCVD